MPKNKAKKLINKYKKPLLFVLVFAAMALVLLVIVRAAPFVRNFEAESATRSGNATVASGSGASGGSYLQFNAPSTGNPPVVAGKRCNIYLSGAGTWQAGQDDYWSEEVYFYAPEKPPGEPRNFWKYDGPHNGAYDPGSASDNQAYLELVGYIDAYISSKGCGPTVIGGGSNGAAFAAKMYCRGVDFDGKVWAYHIDDPPMDNGVIGCSPSANIKKVLFIHSQELRDDSASMPDYRCSRGQWYWYCEDDTTMPLSVYEGHIGQQSILQRRWHSNTDGFNYGQYGFWGIVGQTWWCDWYRQNTPGSVPSACR